MELRFYKMKNYFINTRNLRKFAVVCGLIFAFAQIYSVVIAAQTRKKPASRIAKKKIVPKKQSVANNTNEKVLSATSKVTQIDAAAFKNLLKREGATAKPLLVNFWATWCDPCREEFPELVKINTDYKDKIDFIVVSLDDLAEINRDVPKFLVEMKAEMPAYLLRTQDEEATVASISKDWKGGLPFTILFNEKGEIVYNRQGKVKPEILRSEIDKILPNQTAKLTR